MFLQRYIWQPTDSLWWICGRYLEPSGFADVPTFRDAVVNHPANAMISDWLSLAQGTVIWLPFLVG